jgi:hypothetical protein
MRSIAKKSSVDIAMFFMLGKLDRNFSFVLGSEYIAQQVRPNCFAQAAI